MVRKYFLYILLCSDNSLYTGITPDIDKRMAVHASGKGSKYVKSRMPFKLVYQEQFGNKSDALKCEMEIKSWSRREKIENLGLNMSA